MQVTRNENYTPTAFHANVVAMEKGLVDVEDVADDYVHCTQCGACELRCPNTLFTGDFYRHRTRTVDVVKAMRALMVEQGIDQRGLEALERAPDADHNEPVLGRLPVSQEHVADWADGPRHPDRRRDDPLRRLRGGLLPHLLAARRRALLQAGGVEFGLMREQWCCGGPAAEMGYVDQARKHRRAQRRRLAGGRREADHRASTRTTTSPSPRTTRSTSATTTSSRSCSASSWSTSWSARGSSS